MGLKNEKVLGVVGTVVFHIIIVLFLLVYYLKPTIPQPNLEELSGVPVMFGNIADASGKNEADGRSLDKPDALNAEVTPAKKTIEPNNVSNIQPKQEKVKVTNNPTTQDFEKTTQIEKTNTETVQKQKAQHELDHLIQQKKHDAWVAKQQAEKKGQINNKMLALFGNAKGTNSRGNTQGNGTQGVVTGNASFGKTSGIGGWGSYDLGGRSVGRGGLVKPSYIVDDYGIVVIEILVDSKGNVIEAIIGKGTNTTSAALKREALKAAFKTKFNAVSSVINQRGTITYNFNLN